MDEDKPKGAERTPGRRRVGAFWWGILAGAAILAVLFHRFLLGLLADATGNILPVFFTPGLLELTVGVVGFGLVIVINHLLRREQDDEWVVLEDKDPAAPEAGEKPG